MNENASIPNHSIDAKSLVCTTAETLIMLSHAEKLLGQQLDLGGSERESLFGTIASKVGKGIDLRTLYNLADFVPMAFARVALSDTGVNLPNHFGRKDSQNRIREYRRLDEVPIYCEAFELAQSWWPIRPVDVRNVAKWSGTTKMVENALAKGSKSSDLEFAPTLLNGPDESCPLISESPLFPDKPWWLAQWMPKPWWKFWK
ncbi:MAG: hypothetical protein U0798_04530 [Gemmataceae bacterium]